MPGHARCSVRSVISIRGKWAPPWKLEAAALPGAVRYARVADDDGNWWRGSQHGWPDYSPAAQAAERARAAAKPAGPRRAADDRLAKTMAALDEAIASAAAVRPGDEDELQEMMVAIADGLLSASVVGGGTEERRLPDAMWDCSSKLRATGLEGEVTYNDLARVLAECYRCLHAEFCSEWRAKIRKFAIRGAAGKTKSMLPAAAAAAAPVFSLMANLRREARHSELNSACRQL